MPWDESFIALAPSLHDWLSSWLRGEDMFERLAASEEH